MGVIYSVRALEGEMKSENCRTNEVLPTQITFLNQIKTRHATHENKCS